MKRQPVTTTGENFKVTPTYTLTLSHEAALELRTIVGSLLNGKSSALYLELSEFREHFYTHHLNELKTLEYCIDLAKAEPL